MRFAHLTSVLCGRYIVSLAVLPALVACSDRRSLSHEELQGEFRASISLSGEAESFLRHLEGHRYSLHFIEGHLSYLQRQGSEMEEELAGSRVAGGEVESLWVIRSATRELVQTLGDLQREAANVPAQSTSVNRLRTVRERLEGAMPR